MKDAVIGPGKPKKVSKNPCESKLENGPMMPKEKEMGQRSPRAM